MSLTTYKNKRNFKNTPEPPMGKGNKKANLSFVVQRHDASHLHYDFRLEMEGVLKSWAVPKGPSMKTGDKRLAIMVEDHPVTYGKFYGEIPEGNYGAGTVEIWDSGTYEPMEKVKPQEQEKTLLAQLRKGDLKFIVHGNYLKGAFALVRMHSDDGENKNWLLIKKKDDFSVDKFNIEKLTPVKSFSKKKNAATTVSKRTQPTSNKKPPVKQNETVDKLWPQLKHPMLAKLTTEVPDTPHWLYELKYDGYRALTKISKGKVEMLSRNGNSFNALYAPLVKELETIEDDVILDGEIVIENEKGVSNFQLLQNYSKTKKGVLKYYVFDILFLNGHQITNLALIQRKELLQSFFEKYKLKNNIQSEFVITDGKDFLKKQISKGQEGIMAKNKDSIYLPGKRVTDWLKIKKLMTQEAIICGYTLPQKSRKYFGSLILGIYDNKTLKYIGNCGTGFTDTSLKELHTKFNKLIIDTCPFKEKPPFTGTKGKAVWLKPELVCNVKFAEWTDDKHLRVPVFMGLRTDKNSTEVIKEEPVVPEKAFKKATPSGKGKDNNNKMPDEKLTYTNLTKVYFPEDKITKGDIINYYKTMSKYLLPYLKDRPQSLNRHPNGIKGQSFYQKNMDVAHLPEGIKTVELYSKSNNENIHYLICNDEATLLYMANLGCIEINPWHSTYLQPDNPDYVILDLDPGDISFIEVVNVALMIKEICDQLQIDCYCKTSGATGLHIYIPLGAKYNYDDAKLFAELLARITHTRLPNTTSVERSVGKRKNKIYLDFLQNRKGQTIAAPYSVRPRPHATVSTPLLWKEVNHKLSPQLFTIRTIEKRVNKLGDLWKGILGKPIDLRKVLKKIEEL